MVTLLMPPNLATTSSPHSPHSTKVVTPSEARPIEWINQADLLLEGQALIANIAKMQDRAAEDVATPSAEVSFLTTDMSLGQAVALVAKKGFTLYPLCGDSIDDLKGIIDSKDLLKWLNEHDFDDDDFDLMRLASPPMIIAPTMYVLDILILMRQTRRHLAIIVDEYGGVDGLISMYDVVTAVVGDAETSAIDSGIEPTEDGGVIVDGRTRLEVVLREIEWLGLANGDSIDDEETDTLGGLVVAQIGYVPVTGEHITLPALSCEVEIIEAEPRRVRRVLLRPYPDQR